MRPNLRFFLVFAGTLALATVREASWAAADSGAQIQSPLARKACRLESERPPADGTASDCSPLNGLAERARIALQGAASPPDTLARLNHFFFEVEKFEPNYDLDSPDHLLLSNVLAGKKGYCVGLAAVYLSLAESLDLPIHAVATPKHLFLRWDDGAFRRNIELFEKGREVPDEEYVREEKIPQESIDRGVFLANLSRKQFLGFVYQNLGVLESQREDYESSGRHYARAIHLNRKLAAAYYNRGNDELKQKLYRKAIRDFTKALKLYPTDAWALHNRGLTWKQLGENEKSERDLKRAREIDPALKLSE